MSGASPLGAAPADAAPAALPRFYPIFEDAGWLARMLPLGIRFAQLRVKNRSEAETRAEIRAGLKIARAEGTALVINDYWQIAIEEGAAWIHLGQEDLDTADIAEIRAAGLRLGVSTHDEAELDRALSFAPDYVALGPVWPTILKKMPWAPQGTARIGAWKRRTGAVPLCAIGGLTVARAGEALAAGADLVSVVTDITLHPDPETRVREWLEALP